MELTDRVARLTGTAVRGVTRLGGQHGWSHHRAELADGRAVFVKAGPHGEVFDSEAAGLRWLGEPNAVAVPEVLGAGDELLVLEWVEEETPTPEAAERFGRELAELHLSGADGFGAPWPGFMAELPMDNRTGPRWPRWFAERRLLPYIHRAHDLGHDVTLLEDVVRHIDELAGPDEPPSRIHGDLWSGNVLWSRGRCVLIDPAAHGGHRESDLAMLELFGTPHLARILDAYREAAPLADGHRARVPLHQLHPLLVHVCLFGSSYLDSLLTAAGHALAA